MQKTANNTSLISSIDVAKILGVNVATIKRWTDSGKLDCVKTAGGHRKFLLRHLAAFAMEHEKYSQRLSLLPIDTQPNLELSHQILRADYKELIPYVLDRAVACDQSTVKTILNGLYMVNQDLVSIYDDLLRPVLHRIGEMWMDGTLSVSQEHLASQTIRDGIIQLQDVVVKPDHLEGKAFVLTLGGELHDIPAKMVQHLLEARGFQVLFSGQKTPAGDTISVFKSYKPNRVYLSTVYIENVAEAQAEFKQLQRLCESFEASLFVGGSGVAQLKIEGQANLKLLNNFSDVQNS
ncbi:MAG: B12-binding domain-containing protein [Candidatus Marinimicrobia bacterium]|nr:B12-binding domain-containing protein [Candidatus Neomarinimicrobiota bacterium]MCF7921637.1 B12-binding domain-containing protein [Candidatus Neomarinimicrobiota bacterium]